MRLTRKAPLRAGTSLLVGAVGLSLALTSAGPAHADNSTRHIAATRSAQAATFAPPKIKHVWTIVLENKSYEASFTGLNRNSYLWRTLPSYGLLQRQYYGTSHYSQGNYLSMVSGQGTSYGPQSDCPRYNEALPSTPTYDDQHIINNQGCVFQANVPTLFNQLDAAHVSYKGYMQDMGNDPSREPATCGNPHGSKPGPNVDDPGRGQGPFVDPSSPQYNKIDDQYVAKHNPFPWFHSLLDNGDCAKHVVPLAQNIVNDLAKESTTPNFSLIVPNNCSDAHDATCVGDNLSGGSNALTGEKKPPVNNQGGLYASDLFLQQIIPAIMKSPAYQDGGLIDVLFDEGFPPYKQYGNSIADYAGNADPSLNTPTDTSQSIVACCNELPGPNTTQPGFRAFGQDTTPGGGITGAVLISPFITPGSVTDQPYNHFSFLRSLEDLAGIRSGGSDGKGHLGYAGMEGLRPFGPDVYNNPSALPFGPQDSGRGGIYAARQSLTATEEPVSRTPLTASLREKK